jgi:hypothetical protein
MQSELVKKEIPKDVFVEKFPALYKTNKNTIVMFISETVGICVYNEVAYDDWFVSEIYNDLTSCFDKEVYTRLERGEIVQLFND